MAIDSEKIKLQQSRASENKILKALSKLRMQWSLKESKHCLHNDWFSLAKAVGLGVGDIPALQNWVATKGLRPPTRIDTGKLQ